MSTEGPGQFMQVRERRQSDPSSGGVGGRYLGFGPGGRYEYDEMGKSDIKVGDVVLKRGGGDVG